MNEVKSATQRSTGAPESRPPKRYEAERKRNPFVNTQTGGRVLSSLQLPFFRLRPPRGYGVLTMTGRRTGKTRRKCVRAIRRGDKAFIVSIRQTAWLKNVRANPNVSLQLPGETLAGYVRSFRDEAEAQEATAAYCETVNPFDYGECLLWRKGRPTAVKIKELQRDWFMQGTPLVVELRR